MKKLMTVLSLTFTLSTLALATEALARQGADDPAGHVRGGHGADDGPGPK